MKARVYSQDTNGETHKEKRGEADAEDDEEGIADVVDEEEEETRLADDGVTRTEGKLRIG